MSASLQASPTPWTSAAGYGGTVTPGDRAYVRNAARGPSFRAGRADRGRRGRQRDRDQAPLPFASGTVGAASGSSISPTAVRSHQPYSTGIWYQPACVARKKTMSGPSQ